MAKSGLKQAKLKRNLETPRGVWGAKGAATRTASRSWLGHEQWKLVPSEQVVLRYLAAFGPASVLDICMWSGFTGLRSVVDQIVHIHNVQHSAQQRLPEARGSVNRWPGSM